MSAIQPFDEYQQIEVDVADDGTQTVRVGDRFDAIRTRYGTGRIPGTVVSMYARPRGISPPYDLIPTIVVEYDVQSGEYDHLDGERRRIPKYDADYSLGIHIPDWETRDM